MNAKTRIQEGNGLNVQVQMSDYSSITKRALQKTHFRVHT